MNVKQTLIIIFFMMFIVNFIPRANASLVELEFSNGATVSFDDTVSYGDILHPATDIEMYTREYNTVSTIASHPDNVITVASTSFLRTFEAIGDSANDRFEVYSDDFSIPSDYRSNYIWTKSKFDFIGPDITASLVDMFYADTEFNFLREGLYADGTAFRINEDVTLTSVRVDGISQTSPVPVPGAVWLFGTAISGLIARRKLGGSK